MAFPTIPTRAAARLVSGVQADAVATRTFPSLTGLTKNSGDLLIAIIVAYQSSAAAGAVFSGWTAGWTEFIDAGGTTSNLSIGAAYKWSTGSETGTIAVTQAAAITGHAAMLIMSIPGAHATTPPEGSPIVHGTAAAADPAAFDPAGWAAEDTLWIAVGGNGETAITGSWTGVDGAPTNYISYDGTATADTSTVGQADVAVAFRQLNAASENVGVFSTDLSNARNSALVIAVRPRPPTTTSTARVSLAAAGSTPPTQTQHKLKVRARKLNSAHSGTMRLQLYEGANARSAELETSELTTSLATYTLSVADVDAASITSYSDLELRFRGYSSGGDATQFEVAEAWLEIPGVATDTTPPVPTVGTITATKISRVAGKDSTDVSWDTDEAFVEYEIRRVANASDGRGAGNQVETATVSSRTSHTVTITDDELVAASASEGSNLLKVFVKDAAGNWST